MQFGYRTVGFGTYGLGISTAKDGNTFTDVMQYSIGGVVVPGTLGVSGVTTIGSVSSGIALAVTSSAATYTGSFINSAATSAGLLIKAGSTSGHEVLDVQSYNATSLLKVVASGAVTIPGTSLTLGGDTVAAPIFSINGTAASAKQIKWFSAGVEKWNTYMAATTHMLYWSSTSLANDILTMNQTTGEILTGYSMKIGPTGTAALASGALTVTGSVSATQSGLSDTALYGYASNASYVGNLLAVNTVRSASSSFNLMLAQSNNATQFYVTGAGNGFFNGTLASGALTGSSTGLFGGGTLYSSGGVNAGFQYTGTSGKMFIRTNGLELYTNDSMYVGSIGSSAFTTNILAGNGSTIGTFSSTGLSVTGSVFATNSVTSMTLGSGLNSEAASVASIGMDSAATAFKIRMYNAGYYFPFSMTAAGAVTITGSVNATTTLLVGDTTFSGIGTIGLIKSTVAGTTTYNSWNSATSGTRYHMEFRDGAGATVRGSITSDGANTAFNTSSDARLKDDLGIAVNTSILSNLKIHNFAWKETGQNAVGVFAQEAFQVAPYTVNKGTEGDDLSRPWSVDYSKYVPDLIVGWQSHNAKIAALEQRINQLEQ
jgi:hypothetical protein